MKSNPISMGAAVFGTVARSLLILMLLSAWSHPSVAATTVLYRLKGTPNAGVPITALTYNPTTNAYYGMTAFGGLEKCGDCGTVFEVRLTASNKLQSFRTIYRFTREYLTPIGKLAVDKRGALYGVTTNYCMCGGDSLGLVFRLLPPMTGELDWRYQRLHEFPMHRKGNGSPSGLVLNLNRRGGVEPGTLFVSIDRISGGDSCSQVVALVPGPNRPWERRIVAKFGREGTFGCFVNDPLAIDNKGNLYGTTIQDSEYGGGALFRVTPPPTPDGKWKKSLLYSSIDELVGGVFLLNGHIYGAFSSDYGGIFEAGLDGSDWRTIHEFRGARKKDGASPVGHLTANEYGVIYGVTDRGGKPTGKGRDGGGTVFSLTPPTAPSTAWKERILRRFQVRQVPNNGYRPNPILLLPDRANYLGTTARGGALVRCPSDSFATDGCGTLYIGTLN